MEEMVKYPLIFLEPNSNSRKYVEKFMLSKGIKISPEFELGSFDLIYLNYKEDIPKLTINYITKTFRISQRFLQYMTMCIDIITKGVIKW